MHVRKFAIFTMLLMAVVAVFALVNRLPSRAERAARVAREEARKRGFKLEHSDFVHGLTPAMAAREAAITNAFGGTNPRLPYLRFVGYDGRRTEIRVAPEDGSLKLFAGLLKTHGKTLDAARDVLLEGRPFRSEAPPAAIRLGGSFDSHHSLVHTFFARSALALRAGLADEAWTNLLAANAAALLATPAVAYASQRGSLMHAARIATWESFQYHVWTDARLAELAAIWASPDFFEDVEETLMYEAYQTLERNARGRTETQPSHPGWNRIPPLFKVAFSQPSAAWNGVRRLFQERVDWENHVRRDSYIDDLTIIHNYEERLATIRRVLARKNWPAIRDTPGLTDPVVLLGTNRFSYLRQLNLPLHYNTKPTPDPRGRLIDFSEGINAETTRCLVLAAIAVERARLRLGRLPTTLDEAGVMPDDFMTGRPPIYRPEPTGSYSIYSPGFDQTDNFGEGDDIVWPRRGRNDEFSQ